MHPLEPREIAPLVAGKLVSIIMPFYNEGEVIVDNVGQVLEACDRMGIQVEIIAVDDGSTDNGYEKLTRAYRDNRRVIPVRNETNFGKGWALKTGYEFSHGEYILFLDADLELSPWHLPQFFTRLFEEEADVVIGSKLHPESEVNYPTTRRILSTGYYFFIRLLFRLPVMDTQTGIKLFKREALEASLPKTLVKRFAFDIELLVIIISEGFRITSAPISLQFKRGGIGNIRLKTIWNIFLDTLAVVYRFHILHYYRRRLGKPFHYTWRVILFSDTMSPQERANLSRYLHLPYLTYDIVLIGPVPPPENHPRLRWIKCDDHLYTTRLHQHPEVIEPSIDHYLIGSLLFSPDQKLFLNSGRLLSLPEVGMIGGLVMPAPDETPKGRFFHRIIQSIFFNASYAYRYKHGVQKPVQELGLEGAMIKKQILMEWFTRNQDQQEKLEHQLCRVCRQLHKTILYSPDIVMFGYFPHTGREFFSWVIRQASSRSHQTDGLFVWYGVCLGIVILWLLAVIAPVTNPWLALPWCLYYGFLLGIWPLPAPLPWYQKPLQGIYLAIGQMVYLTTFLYGQIRKHLWPHPHH